jgi:hypothetical protein
LKKKGLVQCFGSSTGSVDPDPAWEFGSGSGSRRAKTTPKMKNVKKVHVLKYGTGYSLWKAEAFFNGLEVLHVGLRITVPGSGYGSSKSLDPDPDLMIVDPQH